jgi:hypothetical protein
MALNPISGGLRRFVNDSTEITRVELRVPPGAELEVDDDVAKQLPPAFKDPDVVRDRDAKRRALIAPAEAEAPAEDADEAEPVKKRK